MCGILGFSGLFDCAALSAGLEAIAHRGPDHSGLFTDEGAGVGLGHTRLSIIDPSPAGHMPMSNEDGTVWIVHNGEIYNFPELRQGLLKKGHTFRSHTDTEVVIHLYEEEGRECVNRLNGMFAFAICDLRPPTPLLFLARDQFGVKPLYYIQRGYQFAFASEVKALLHLLDVQTEVDLEALNQYLTFLWVPDPKTMFRGVFKLPAGHYAVFQNGNLDLTRYWDLAFPPANACYSYTEAELVEEIRERFRRSVQAQMISDVPIGAFLSAGVDSSSIVAMMAQVAGGRVRTYTVTFPPKYRVGETTLDDPGVAYRVAQHFGCDHHEIVVEPQVAELLPKLVWHMDEPVSDPAIITAYLVCREARHTVTVLLSGIGGDELFAGYRKHYAYYWAEAYRRLPGMLRRNLIEPAILGLPALRGTRFKGLMRLAKKMACSGSLPPQDAFLMNSTYLNEEQKSRLYSPDMRGRVIGLNPWQQHQTYFKEVTHTDFLNQMLYLDVKAFLVSLNLTYNDKMSMASSVEVRVPFLDRELAEFVAWHVPPRLKLNGFLRPTTKYIFRRAMEGILPNEVLRQPKAGFGAPVDYWLASDLRVMVDDLLSEEQIRRRGFFEPGAVRRLVKEHRSGREDWSMQIWQLLTFELWLQMFVDRPQADTLQSEVLTTQSMRSAHERQPNS